MGSSLNRTARILSAPGGKTETPPSCELYNNNGAAVSVCLRVRVRRGLVMGLTTDSNEEVRLRRTRGSSIPVGPLGSGMGAPYIE